MISIFKQKSDKKYQKSMKSMAYLLNETAAIRDCVEKMMGLIQQSRDFLATLATALSTSMAGQVDILKKMEKFYDLQIRWAEEQEKIHKTREETEDDKRF